MNLEGTFSLNPVQLSSRQTYLTTQSSFPPISGQPYSFVPTPLSSPSLDPQPVMLSEASTIRSELGGTLTLPCRVKDLGPFILIWKKGNR